MPQILDVVALSPTQAGMTAISRADPTYDPYLVTISLDLVGVTPHLISRLRPALAALCRRHPHLLGRVRSEGLPHPVLLVLDSGCPMWQGYDFRTEPDPMAAAQRFRATEGNRPLSISDGPLIRATLLHVGGEDSSGHCILLLTMHHLVIDGWCMPLLIEELVALIRGDEALLGSPVPLRNHVAWLRNRLSPNRHGGRSLRIWRRCRVLDVGSVFWLRWWGNSGSGPPTPRPS